MKCIVSAVILSNSCWSPQEGKSNLAQWIRAIRGLWRQWEMRRLTCGHSSGHCQHNAQTMGHTYYSNKLQCQHGKCLRQWGQQGQVFIFKANLLTHTGTMSLSIDTGGAYCGHCLSNTSHALSMEPIVFLAESYLVLPWINRGQFKVLPWRCGPTYFKVLLIL